MHFLVYRYNKHGVGFLPMRTRAVFQLFHKFSLFTDELSYFFKSLANLYSNKDSLCFLKLAYYTSQMTESYHSLIEVTYARTTSLKRLLTNSSTCVLLFWCDWTGRKTRLYPTTVSEPTSGGSQVTRKLYGDNAWTLRFNTALSVSSMIINQMGLTFVSFICSAVYPGAVVQSFVVLCTLGRSVVFRFIHWRSFGIAQLDLRRIFSDH